MALVTRLREGEGEGGGVGYSGILVMKSNNSEKQDGKARILYKPVLFGGLVYGSLGTRSVSHELEPKIFPFWPSHSINKCVLKRIIFLSSDNALN